MNRIKIDNNLLKNLDLINFWEPFERSHPNLKIGIRAILADFRAKQKLAKAAKTDIDKVSTPRFEKPILICYNTLNQKAALGALVDKLGGHFDLISESPRFKSEQLPESYLISQSMHYQTRIIKWFYQFKGYDKSVFVSRYYNFYKRLGQYRHYYRAFLGSEQNLKCYIATNDHSGLSQVGFVAARNAGIQTIYIQHASISDRFPPLKSTYAFLDGQDAKEKYLQAGNTNTQIELLGPMKYDAYLNRKELETPGDLVGICLGLAHCDLEENLRLCHLLASANIPFCLRFHPLMDEETQTPFQGHGWGFSNPKDEHALDFILRCHTLVSPDSNIHLESILLKRRPVYFTPKDGALDYYDFVKNGVLEPAIHQAKEIVESLSQPYEIKPHRRKAKHYHAALYTDWEGKSTERIEARIREIAGLDS